MTKPVSERRYPRERRHNLPTGRQALVEQARREAVAAGCAVDNAEHELVYDPQEKMMVITFFESE